MAVGREKVIRVLQALSSQSCGCHAHSQAYANTNLFGSRPRAVFNGPQNKEYAFEMASSNIRYGSGVTKEVGMDLVNLGVKNVCILTDKNLVNLPPVATALSAVHSMGIKYSVFDRVSIEPTNESFKEAAQFALDGSFDGFLAVGGGSVMDTAKAANLYSCFPENDFLDFVNAPIGKGMPVTRNLKPLVCGSETTGVAIFDHKPLKAKTGIGSRAMRPTLGIVDPLHTKHMPYNVTVYSGFDVLCHAIESFTAIPYNERTPCPKNPIERPAYQGSNPVSDIWAIETMKIIKKFFKRSVSDSEDIEARSAMHMASAFAGMGFGNAGVHLPHGMSYPLSGLVKDFTAPDYNPDKSLVPHGLSVVLTAPAVVQFTAPMCPERHLLAAELLGGDVQGVKSCDAGRALADVLRGYMQEMGVVNGISSLGYSSEDIPALVKGTIPQHRVTKLCPKPVTEESLAELFKNSLTIY